jgi:hypothetical protein
MGQRKFTPIPDLRQYQNLEPIDIAVRYNNFPVRKFLGERKQIREEHQFLENLAGREKAL